MKLCQSLPSNFTSDYWRKKPLLLRNHLSFSCKNIDWDKKFESWCVEPVISRLFIPNEEIGLGLAFGYEPESPIAAHKIFKTYGATNEKLTLMLNGIEKIDDFICRLRRELYPKYVWRYDDIVATLSSVGSGIGYHAGHEDGFLVQLSGSREWKIWSPDVLSKEYRFNVLKHPQYNDIPTPPRPTPLPSHHFFLNAGDVIYLPPLFAHEGLTTQRSIALSIAWRGLWPAYLLEQALGSSVCSRDEINDYSLYEIIEDPENENINIPDHIIRKINGAIKLLKLNNKDIDSLHSFIFSRYLSIKNSTTKTIII